MSQTEEIVTEEQPVEYASTSGSSAAEEINPADSDKAVASEMKPATAEVKPPKKNDERDEPMVRIWFATNRKMNEKGDYTGSHDLTNTYGRLDIELEVAQHHSPPKKHMSDLQFVKRSETDFFEEIEQSLSEFAELGVTPQVCVALHNYNVGFEESLVAASHWHEDLNVAGPTISYSWPSAGKNGHYEPDAAAMERSEPEILDFLTKISVLSGSENVHLVADGTACHGLLRVFQRMSADGIDLKLGQIFLLAPDVDRDLFIDLSWLFPKYSTRTTMYASQVDRDAKKSVKRHQAPRAGIFEPYTIVDGIDTIAIPSLETDDLRSEKKTRAYEIVTLFYDMYDLMKSNAPPRRRLHLSKQVADGKTFWKLRKLPERKSILPFF